MKSKPTREAFPHPQPLATPGLQRRTEDAEQDEIGAARAWLRHVEAGRIGGA
ncbi:MAG: hypothetical protein ABIS39_03040 [Sphingomicrobium sp.]